MQTVHAEQQRQIPRPFLVARQSVYSLSTYRHWLQSEQQEPGNIVDGIQLVASATKDS